MSLLPTTLQEYEEALPDLSREKVLTIFREVETTKSGKLSLCREVRRQIIAEEEEGDAGLRRPKLSCLSPIVEQEQVVAGRDSALGTSGTSHSSATASQHTDRYPLSSQSGQADTFNAPVHCWHFGFYLIEINQPAGQLRGCSRQIKTNYQPKT